MTSFARFLDPQLGWRHHQCRFTVFMVRATFPFVSSYASPFQNPCGDGHSSRNPALLLFDTPTLQPSYLANKHDGTTATSLWDVTSHELRQLYACGESENMHHFFLQTEPLNVISFLIYNFAVRASNLL